MAKKFYGVKQGRINGVFKTWEECKQQIHGYKGAIYKGFDNLEDARAFVLGEEPPQFKDGAVAYVDGSYNLKTKIYSCGVVILYKGEEIKINKAYDNENMVTMRNVAGEIMGAVEAMKWAIKNKVEGIHIYYDYRGIECWCTGEWKTTKTGTLAYADFYQKASQLIKIDFHKVQGHSGDKYNDMADALAKEAAGMGPAKQDS